MPVSPPCMLRMVVSGSQTGSLIGKGGSKINSIREKSGASIRVIEDAHPSCCQGDRIIFVRGETSNVKDAVLMIARHLKDHPPREGVSNLWKGQSTHSPVANSDPGMFGQGPLSTKIENTAETRTIGRPGLRIKVHREPEGKDGRYRKDADSRGKRDRSRERESEPAKRSPSSAAPRGSPLAASRAFRHTITEMHVPVSDMGRIIGRNGVHIKSVRSKSGATVRVLDSTRGPQVRLVEIIGDAEQATNAQRMINELIDGAKT